MKKRFLPFSLLLVIMILGQSVIADQGGHYVPRTQPTMNAESFMGSLRANQKTGLIDPADMFKAMQAPATRNHADDPLYWISMGPDNMGGQTTAVLYDNRLNSYGNPNGVVYIGSKGGGVYRTYNHGITWHQVGGLNLMVSCMVQDADGVIYVGTGDGNNGVSYNGLSQQNYDNSFIGTGLYTLTDDVFEQIKAPTADEWLYINDLAFAGNLLLAATDDGLMCSNDKGRNWTNVIEGNAVSVKVATDNTIVAVVDNLVYIGKDVNNLICHTGTTSMLEGDSLLPKPSGMVDIAIAPSNSNIIYVSCIDSNGKHIGVFVSEDKGETWNTAFPSVSSNQGHELYAGFGLYNHAIVVDPENEGLLYVLGYYLWSLQKPVNGGLYLASQINTDSYFYFEDYLHVGLHTMVFNPNNSQECYIGTDGGVYKGTGRFVFSNCNRNYPTTRMFNVGVSGKDTRILAAGLDHGTVLIEGDENSNTVNSGLWINPTGTNMGYFDDASHAGPCAISVLNPKTFFVTYKGGGLERTETAGEDWVSTNFTSSSTLGMSTNSFRLPILLYEEYNNQRNPETAWFFNKTEEDIPSGTEVMVESNNNYPFHYTLTAPLVAGDSVEVHDPITATFFVAFTDALSMTRTPLQFNVEAEWYKVADKAHTGFTGEPLSMALSADGDNMFVGMKGGRFFRVSGINTVLDATSGSITDSLFAVTTTEIVLPIDEQCITSVSVDPRDNNKVVVTCGNYGNDNYVFYSTDAMSDAPTFVAKQANLPKMPVYSCLIEMESGDVILGTERGIYRTDNINNPTWTFDGAAMGEVPVMELKQQTIFHEDEQTVNVTDEGEFVTVYPGVYNTGIIYAATYGKGVYRCENYKKDFASVPETPSVNNVNVSMYPNPVSGQATLSFNLNESCNVSYQVFDLTGRMVMNQGLGRFAEGEHHVSINAENLSTGSYILRLNQGASNSCVKFMVY